jgi:hypothetical protein
MVLGARLAPLRPALLFGIINITDVTTRIESGVRVRTTLISAITACAERRLQRKARNFLLGLSTDELQYIAEFLGACALESLGRTAYSRRELAEGIAQFEQVRRVPAESLHDQEHKMILLLEYLCRSRLTYCSLAVRAERM